METPQGVLFVGKKARHFYSQVEYSEALKQNRVTLFWGGVSFTSYLEIDERPIRNTLAVAFANAGMSKVDIGRVLRMNPKQVFAYVRKGNSVTVGTPGRPPLVTEEVEAYIHSEYRRLCGEGRRRWREEVRQGVREKFHLELSLDTLSHVVAPLSKGSYKEKCDGGEEQAPGESEKHGAAQSESHLENAEAPSPELSPPGETMGESAIESSSSPPSSSEHHTPTSEATAESNPEETPEENAPEVSSLPEASEENEVVYIPFQAPADPTELPEAQETPSSIVVEAPKVELPNRLKLEQRLNEGFYSRYAAGLLLNPFIARLLQGAFDKERPVDGGVPLTLESFALTFVQMNQYGCHNYESLLKLHADEFGVLAGVDRSPSLSTFYRLTPDFLESLTPIEFASRITRNYLRHLAVGSRLFFLDGHFQRYYGRKRMAMGFHPQTRSPQPGYYQYVLSGQDGTPLLLQDSDTLLSFSDSIAHLVPKLVPLLPERVVPWLVFDRGGYDRKLLSRFGGAEACENQFAAHYITWELADDTDYRAMELDWQEVILELKGNDIDHPRVVAFKVAEAPREVRRGIWANTSPARGQRRLVLRRDYERPDGVKTLCTPFCTDDCEASRADLVAALTWRWREENGFKLGDSDYGFADISTYATNRITPEILQDIPEEFHESIKTRKVPNRAVQRIDKERKQVQSEFGRITERLERIRQGKKVRPDRSKLRLPNDAKALSALRDERLNRLHQLEAERELLPKQVTRFDRLCEEGTERLDFQKKWMLDILRASAQNTRRVALDTWMSVYPNWRDYTQRFRDLLNVGGQLQLRGETLHVELHSMQQPRYQQAAEAFMKKTQRLSPKTFGIGPYPICFSFRA